jgi:hypothetical protein
MNLACNSVSLSKPLSKLCVVAGHGLRNTVAFRHFVCQAIDIVSNFFFWINTWKIPRFL